tara:strand:+ start:2641 stop:3225 length:585 start_codon:yes stop_codon:yes gene_type:complete
MINKIKTNGIYSSIDGLHISHPLSAIECLSEVVADFETIIEIGYYRGGLTQYFAEFSRDSCQVIAYDIKDDERKKQNFQFNSKITFKTQNCFSEESVLEIKSIILNSNKTLLFCDGGDKDREFNLFSDFLKQDDVIMVHDYHDDSLNEEYAMHVNWHHAPECFYSEIERSVTNNNLKKYNYEPYRNNLIGSFIK